MNNPSHENTTVEFLSLNNLWTKAFSKSNYVKIVQILDKNSKVVYYSNSLIKYIMKVQKSQENKYSCYNLRWNGNGYSDLSHSMFMLNYRVEISNSWREWTILTRYHTEKKRFFHCNNYLRIFCTKAERHPRVSVRQNALMKKCCRNLIFSHSNTFYLLLWK